VVLFVGCHGRFHDPAVPRAAAEVLRSAGYRVVAAQEVCCGSPALGVGDERRAKESLEANARLLGHLSARLGGGVPIVSPCPSCSLSLRHLLVELVGDERARAVADAVWDLGEFLAGPARVGLEQALDRPRPRRHEEAGPAVKEPAAIPWTYHVPCHLRALGVGKPFPALLTSVELSGRLDAGAAADGCCGMGGLTGLTREGHDLSLAAGARVLEAYRGLAPAGPVVLSDCPACRWQIGEATGLETAHPVELLAARLKAAKAEGIPSAR
jgi:glycerol-3-phosphate dehydrogenase subunit C